MSGHRKSTYKKFMWNAVGVEICTILEADKARINAFEVWALRIPLTEKIKNDEKNGYSEINGEHVEIE